MKTKPMRVMISRTRRVKIHSTRPRREKGLVFIYSEWIREDLLSSKDHGIIYLAFVYDQNTRRRRF